MTPILRPSLLAALVLVAAGSAQAAVFIYNSHPVLEIPDGSSSGVADTIHVTDAGSVGLVSLVLDLVVPDGEVGFAGDVYVYLQHGSNQSVLLNRPGRSASSTSGYDDGVPISVTFSDTAVNGDIHNYRMTLSGNNLLPLSSTLTGTWQPDGRAVDPGLVQPSDPRTAGLSVFNGAPAAGDWSLFAADLSGGGVYRLENWSLRLEVTPVPEPELAAAATGGVLLAMGLAKKLRRPI